MENTKLSQFNQKLFEKEIQLKRQYQEQLTNHVKQLFNFDDIDFDFCPYEPNCQHATDDEKGCPECIANFIDTEIIK